MSEIEKMYRTAKVVPSHHYCNDCQYDMSAECPIRCPDNVAVYPPFTAEKQIELIKWLGHRRHIDIDIYNIKGCTIYDISNDYDCIIDEHKFMFDSNTFEDALAGLINQVWYSLTLEEKQQVKGILE